MSFSRYGGQFHEPDAEPEPDLLGPCPICGAEGDCDCLRDDEPEPASEQDLRCSGSFAESQARLARALDLLTGRVAPHLREEKNQ